MIIADTGFWIALRDANDQHHEAAKRALAVLDEPLVTTWPVLTETCLLFTRRYGERESREFIEKGIEGAYDLFDLPLESLPRIAELMHRYARLPMDLADASLVILAEHLGTGRILSTDLRDFGAYRWKNHKPFRNILLG